MSASSLPPLRLDARAVQAIQNAALSGYPDEVCGLLLGVRGTGGSIVARQAVPVPNVAPAEMRSRRYAIDPHIILRWERAAQAEGWSIVGYFHSHPDTEPRPSAVDAELAWPTYAYVIAGVLGRERDEPLMSGLAAWTFDDASSSFRELPIEVEVGVDEIEYYI